MLFSCYHTIMKGIHMSDLAARFNALSDDQIMELAQSAPENFEQEAQEQLQREVNRRGLTIPEPVSESEVATGPHIDEDLLPLPATFSVADMPLVKTILLDAAIPYTAQNSANTDAIPLESEAEAIISVSVPASMHPMATQILHEHFDHIETSTEVTPTHNPEELLGQITKRAGAYVRKSTSTRDSLMAFSFSDVHLSPAESDEIIDAQFAPAEATAIMKLLTQIGNEVEAVEERLGRFLFYFDNLDHCESHLLSNKGGYTRTDFLTILEILQAYRDTDLYPGHLDTVAQELLEFFS